MPRPVRRREHRRHRERGGDGGDPQMAGEAALERVDLLAHRAGVGDDAARPVEHPFALGREAVIAGAALHQQHAERILELLDAGRQCGLTNVARLRRAPEMLLARQRYDEFQLVDHRRWTEACARSPPRKSATADVDNSRREAPSMNSELADGLPGPPAQAGKGTYATGASIILTSFLRKLDLVARDPSDQAGAVKLAH